VPDGESDADVIERSWRNPECFAELFDRHASEIHRYAARRMSPQVAGDVVSEVFLAAFRNRGRRATARCPPGTRATCRAPRAACSRIC